ncbi:glycoside hydrolase family 15 protein [Rhizohabitans arisaemae]|uniref:glycoside hydrolase family 15 protein n=1 Tax=Rhizohabitans arisaemae TaxID=2720610 RepID=UPI0024B0E43E|nr:glycoside hydrolase family 15 protein [Rhizohabitans arisaemae]
MSVGSTPTLAELARLVSRSVDVIKSHQSPSGAYPASPDFSAYRGYSWLRDGAFIAEGMSRSGDAAGAGAFHTWCARVIGARAGRVESLVERAARGEAVPAEEMLPTRFTLDGADGADDWWNHQLDGYGTWLWALDRHLNRHGADLPDAVGAARIAARYLTAFWRQPCYDWWEEHLDRRHVSTLGAIHAGLRAAIRLGAAGDEARTAVAGIERLIAAEGVAGGPVDGLGPSGPVPPEEGTAPGAATGARPGEAGPVRHLTKWLGTDAVDASLLACVEPFGLVAADHPIGVATVTEVERRLARDGGVHRYLADTFYGGGRWILLAGFLGWNHARAGRPGDALRYLRWMAGQATPAGELPEQVSGVLLAPDRHAEWVKRWGTVATPLLWSHGMYLILADELGIRP